MMGKKNEELKNWENHLKELDGKLHGRESELNRKLEDADRRLRELALREERLNARDQEFQQTAQRLREWEASLQENREALGRSLSSSRQQELDAERMKSEWEAKSALLEEDRSRMAEQEKDLAERIKTVVEKEEALTLREMNESAAFARQQQEAFDELIRVRSEELSAWEEKLRTHQRALTEELKNLKSLESRLLQKDMELKERELEAEGLYAENGRKMLAEVTRREEACLALRIQLEERERQLDIRDRELHAKEEALRQRDLEVTRAERERDAGFVGLRQALDDELEEKRRAAEAALQEKLQLRARELERALDERLAEQQENLEKEFGQYRTGVEQRRLVLRQSEQAERERLAAEREEERKAIDAQHSVVKTSLEEKERQLTRMEQEVQEKQFTLQQWEERLTVRKESLDQREQLLEDEVDEAVTAKHLALQTRLETALEECSSLRDEFQRMEKRLHHFESLRAALGDDPEVVRGRIVDRENRIAELQDRLAQSVPPEVAAEKEQLENQCRQLRAELHEIRTQREQELDQINQASDFMIRTTRLEQELALSKNIAEDLQAVLNQKDEQLKRYRVAYENKQETDERIKEFTKVPYLSADKITLRDRAEPLDEIIWLENIREKAKAHGLIFQPRILEAFHTSLKVAEWSPLSVLAGVSGTGKSELPRIYAHFGGLHYHMLSVQPNWDSQEAMLGFFNSIDNKFDAQPILRFLVQSQQEWLGDEQPGLKDVMHLVLLDEMNLAHPELYFADFLSKLETRRSTGKQEVPKLEINLGAGMKRFELPLGRNVLWTGTMNQDETTKSLSDKVLDRSMVLYFPRPKTLHRRESLSKFPKRAPFLHVNHWKQWQKYESIFAGDKDIQPYMEMVEHMNGLLSEVGRAMGHRVWQSIEYYMSNHPRVLEAVQKEGGDPSAKQKAMRIAFEDQLVQKVMPKLRGIESRARSRGRTKCLDPMLHLLKDAEYSMAGDFELAMELGHGQFLWQSANYLNANEPDADPEEDSLPDEKADKEVVMDGDAQNED